ncbi:MAG: carboxymuconolactone decarboxylase family protein [Microbacterium sp.]|uniref:carboxymuconolactone decarboxylase family protein n=1 Tax=Microbacterium sp. TaxID=51671 RepID=UPI0039E2E3DE
MTERLRRLRPSDLDEDQRAVYRSITGGARAVGPQLFELVDGEGCLNGPFNAMLVAPRVGEPLQALGAAVRYATSLSGRIREIAILAVATATGSGFERYAHEPIGRAAGLTDGELRALRELGAFMPDDPAEALALEVVVALLGGRDVDDETYARARGLLGEVALVELSVLVGYYQALATTMRLFRIGAPRPAARAGDEDAVITEQSE